MSFPLSPAGTCPTGSFTRSRPTGMNRPLVRGPRNPHDRLDGRDLPPAPLRGHHRACSVSLTLAPATSTSVRGSWSCSSWPRATRSARTGRRSAVSFGPNFSAPSLVRPHRPPTRQRAPPTAATGPGCPSLAPSTWIPPTTPNGPVAVDLGRRHTVACERSLRTSTAPPAAPAGPRAARPQSVQPAGQPPPSRSSSISGHALHHCTLPGDRRRDPESVLPLRLPMRRQTPHPRILEIGTRWLAPLDQRRSVEPARLRRATAAPERSPSRWRWRSPTLESSASRSASARPSASSRSPIADHASSSITNSGRAPDPVLGRHLTRCLRCEVDLLTAGLADVRYPCRPAQPNALRIVPPRCRPPSLSDRISCGSPNMSGPSSPRAIPSTTADRLPGLAAARHDDPFPAQRPVESCCSPRRQHLALPRPRGVIPRARSAHDPHESSVRPNRGRMVTDRSGGGLSAPEGNGTPRPDQHARQRQLSGGCPGRGGKRRDPLPFTALTVFVVFVVVVVGVRGATYPPLPCSAWSPAGHRVGSCRPGASARRSLRAGSSSPPSASGVAWSTVPASRCLRLQGVQSMSWPQARAGFAVQLGEGEALGGQPSPRLAGVERVACSHGLQVLGDLG